MSFDYGSSEVVSTLGSSIKKWPTDGRMVGLVDADSISYIVGYSSDLVQYYKMQRDPNWRESDIWQSKKDHANFLLNKYLTAAGCDSALLFLTDSANNFRLKIAKTKVYKGERPDEKPPFFYEIRDWLVEFHSARMSQGNEADDEISIEAWKRHLEYEGELWTSEHKRFSQHVVISADKDLGMIPGWRCPTASGILEWVEPLGELNPKWKTNKVKKYEHQPLFDGVPVSLDECHVIMKYAGELRVRSAGLVWRDADKWEHDYVWFNGSLKQDVFKSGKNKGKGKFKRVEVGVKESETIADLKGVGLKFFYAQLIMGDTADNYPGIPGRGAAYAYGVLESCISEIDLYAVVRAAYRNYYKTTEIADVMLLEQARLAWMQTKQGELWIPPTEERGSFPVRCTKMSCGK